MNRLMKSTITMTFTLISAFTWAQSSEQAPDLWQQVVKKTEVDFNGTSFIEALTSNDLPVNAAGAILPSGNERTYRVLRKLTHGIPPSKEGIPGFEQEPSGEDLIQHGYSTSVLLRRTEEDAMRKPMGRRILFYETQAARIIENSGLKPAEEATRLILNRGVDVTQNTIRWAGRNAEYVAQFAAQLYQQHYEVAQAYLNNPPMAEGQVFPRAKVGIYYARVLFSHHGALISDSAKAIMLIKLLGYLGQDLNSDLKRRTEDYRYALLDIMNLQKQDDQYQNILRSLENRKEPRSGDLAGLRSQISRILSSLPKN